MCPSEIRFAADAMVQSLAKWLRILGYDCIAGDEYFGRKLVEWAVQEDRWILSKNTTFDLYLPKSLLGRMRLCLITSERLPDQLREVVIHFDLDRERFLFTRCVKCNAPLEDVDRAAVEDQLPPDVAANQTRFWRCPQCGRTYWHGSHVSRSIDRLHGWGADLP